jgi:hypothetical protein
VLQDTFKRPVQKFTVKNVKVASSKMTLVRHIVSHVLRVVTRPKLLQAIVHCVMQDSSKILRAKQDVKIALLTSIVRLKAL